MSEFLGFAWELLAKVVYNVVAVVSSILNLLVFGWVEYFNIFMTYFTTFDLVGKIGAIILFAMLIAVPVLIVAILVHRYRINRRLHRDDTSNKALYREIGRLNKQVLDLMDEKNKLLALKVNAMGGTKQIPYVGASALADDHLPTVGNVVGAATGTAAGAPAGEGATAAVVSGNASLALDGAGVKDAAAAMAKATVEAKTLAEEKEIAQANRFPKLSLVDLKYRDWESPAYDDAISLEDFVDSFRAFACSQMKLYYTPEIIRRFVAGMAASKLLIWRASRVPVRRRCPTALAATWTIPRPSCRCSRASATAPRCSATLTSSPSALTRPSSSAPCTRQAFARTRP